MALTASDGQASQPEIEIVPLPSKRGEIGYVEGIHSRQERSHSPEIVLPARHPADRDAPPVVDVVPTNSTPNSSNIFVSPSSFTLLSTTESTAKKNHILGFLQPQKVPTLCGVRLTTLLAFICQTLLIAATIAGWVLSARQTSKNHTSVAGPPVIAVHLIFVLLLVAQILLLERRIFRLRAERYNFLHGEILPTSQNAGMTDPNIAFSPWNRPPLPTYAAALAQSGVGTGDVEDHLVAAPPPPAYGNTRGSTLILTGYLPSNLRAQRPISEHSQVIVRDGRPVSYVSEDEQWEEIQNAERAQRLEETLSQLERPRLRS